VRPGLRARPLQRFDRSSDGACRGIGNRWRNLLQNLAFVPGVIVVAFIVAGIALVEIDNHVDLDGVRYVFQGDASAARTVLQVIAGSLITVAGLTFSITMVVLQLASSQFSPRILRTFFGDRVTQVTIGVYVGTFAYSLLVLRETGSIGGGDFVPRLSVTLASLLGIVAVGLLIVFLNHVAQMVQVSHVMADIAHKTLTQTDTLFPSGYGSARAEDADALLRRWRADPSGLVHAARPGFVQRITLDELADAIAGQADHAAVLVCPGDFVSIDTAVVEVWPAEAAEACQAAIERAVFVASERDLHQDVDFGLRQLADTALRAMSPGINDPATAVTCIGYLRSILARLATRDAPPEVRRFPGRGLTLVVRRRAYAEYLESLLQIDRYVGQDTWVAGELLRALEACDRAAQACGAHARHEAIAEAARVVADRALSEADHDRDRRQIERLAAWLSPG
jgi:uncharacterized membrane protein